MNCSKTLLALAIAGGLSLVGMQPASAQVVLVGPPVLVPTYAPPVVVASPYPVVPSYRVPSVPTVGPRIAGYGAYQPVGPAPVYTAPVYAAPVYAAPAPVTVTSPVPIYGAPAPVPVTSPVSVAAPNVLYRPAVVGSSISGLPTVYVPGQPVRNALRYVVP